MPKYTIFQEKQVRKSILKKASLTNINKDGKHWTADIELNGEIVSFIKIPNEHNKDFWVNKAKNIADQLMLDIDGYNRFVKCSMKSSEYLKILEEK